MGYTAYGPWTWVTAALGGVQLGVVGVRLMSRKTFMMASRPPNKYLGEGKKPKKPFSLKEQAVSGRG